MSYDCDFNVDASVKLDYALSSINLSASRAIRVTCDPLVEDIPFSITVTSGLTSLTKSGVALTGSTDFTSTSPTHPETHSIPGSIRSRSP